MSANPLRLAVIGPGMGAAHAAAYLELPNAELVAICDVPEPWLCHCEAAWGVPAALTHHVDLLGRDDIDAVSVAVPTHLHGALTVTCRQRGRTRRSRSSRIRRVWPTGEASDGRQAP